MKNSVLIAIDGSYMQYHSIFRAIRRWSKRNRLEAKSYLSPRLDGSQSNLINSDTFKTELYNSFLHTCYIIPEIIESNFPQYRGFDIKGYSTIVFCADDYTSNGFRKQLYEDYKGGRDEVRAKNPYDLGKIKQYFNVIFDQTDVWNRCGYKYAFVDGAEGDDIIYRLMTIYRQKYDMGVIIASDKDLLQIPDVMQFDLGDNLVERDSKTGELTAKEFLLRKILIGDTSDNIPKVFDRVGPVKAEKIIKEGRLKDMLIKDKQALEQFNLNMKLIDMSKMPTDLTTRIDNTLAKLLSDIDTSSDIDDEIEKLGIQLGWLI